MNYRPFLVFIVLTILIVPFRGVHAGYAPVAGDLVKGTSAAVYYVTSDGKRMAFPNESTYFSWYKNFSAVKIITDSEIAALSLAGLVTLRPGQGPVQIESDAGIYAIAHGGVLRQLKTDALAQMIFGADWRKKVVMIPASFFVSYQLGDPVTDGGQYWWKNEINSSPDIAHDLIAVSGSTPGQTVMAFETIPKTAIKKTVNLVVGLWNPQDPAVTYIPTPDEIKGNIFTGNSKGQSVADYYSKMSGGSVTLHDAGVFGWYPADKPFSHYWATPDPTDADNDGYVNGHNEKWAETILKMDKEFDFSSYDANHDGILSPDELGVLIVIPANSPFGTNRVVMSQEFPVVKPMVVDGVSIGMIAEWYTGTTPNFGVVAHELSHLFFNTADMYLDNKFRAGTLSLMDGSYCNCYIDPWQRQAMGRNWLNILKTTGNGFYELPSINTSDSVIKLTRPGKDEFLLLEYRKHDLYQDTGNSGLLVWDILNSSVSGDWGRNNIHLLRANGGTPPNDLVAAYSGTAALTVSTGSIHWFDGSDSGISLTDIGVPGETIKFKLNFSPLALQ